MHMFGFPQGIDQLSRVKDLILKQACKQMGHQMELVLNNCLAGRTQISYKSEHNTLVAPLEEIVSDFEVTLPDTNIQYLVQE